MCYQSLRGVRGHTTGAQCGVSEPEQYEQWSEKEKKSGEKTSWLVAGAQVGWGGPCAEGMATVTVGNWLHEGSTNPIVNILWVNGARLLTIWGEDYRYRKGENENALCIAEIE